MSEKEVLLRGSSELCVSLSVRCLVCFFSTTLAVLKAAQIFMSCQQKDLRCASTDAPAADPRAGQTASTRLSVK